MPKPILFAIATLLSTAAGARAHQYVMRPVDVEIKIEPAQIEVRVDAHAAYWLDAIMRVPMTTPLPATGWPEKFESAAREYIESCFSIQMDGQTLAPETFRCRFIQEPLQQDDSRVQFTLRYPVVALGRRLSVRSRFFPEVREQELNERDHGEDPSDYVTRLKVTGSKSVAVDLPFEKPEFSFNLEGMAMTPSQQRAERLRDGAMRVFSSPFFWIALVALIYQAYIRISRRKDQ